MVICNAALRFLARPPVWLALLLCLGLCLQAGTFAAASAGERKSMELRVESGETAGNAGRQEKIRTEEETKAGTEQTPQQTSHIAVHSFAFDLEPDCVSLESSLKLKNAGPIRTQLLDGAVMKLDVAVRVERLNFVLANSVIGEQNEEFSLRHDLLTREFVLSGHGRTLREKHFSDLLTAFFGNVRFSLPLSETLNSEETYRLTLELRLQHAEVPPWLTKTLLFWSWDVVPPLSIVREFTFKGEAR